MKKIWKSFLISVSALLVVVAGAGCGGSEPAPGPLSVPGPAPQGNVQVRVGDRVEVTHGTNHVFASFTLDKITVQDSCDLHFVRGSTGQPYVEKKYPKNGHFIFLDITVTTAPDFQSPFILGTGFTVVGPDGVTETDAWNASVPCEDKAQQGLSGDFKPGQKYQGKVALDSRNASGTLIYTEYEQPRGYEWKF